MESILFFVGFFEDSARFSRYQKMALFLGERIL